MCVGGTVREYKEGYVSGHYSPLDAPGGATLWERSHWTFPREWPPTGLRAIWSDWPHRLALGKPSSRGRGRAGVSPMEFTIYLSTLMNKHSFVLAFSQRCRQRQPSLFPLLFFKERLTLWL